MLSFQAGAVSSKKLKLQTIPDAVHDEETSDILTQNFVEEVVEDPKRLFKTFDMADERDVSWIKAQNVKCDAWNSKGRYSGPWLFINMTKRLQVDYYPIGDKIEVVFRKLPYAGMADYGPCELKLTVDEWEAFKEKFERFWQFIEAVENNTSVQEAMVDSRPPIEWEISGKFAKCKGLVTGDLPFILKWSGQDRTCTIDIRRRVRTQIPGGGMCWKNLDEGVCLSARAFQYLTKHLAKKVDNGVRMWSSFGKTCGHLAESCLFSYDPLAKKNSDFSWTVENLELLKPVEDEEIFDEMANYQERHMIANFGEML